MKLTEEQLIREEVQGKIIDAIVNEFSNIEEDNKKEFKNQANKIAKLMNCSINWYEEEEL